MNDLFPLFVNFCLNYSIVALEVENAILFENSDEKSPELHFIDNLKENHIISNEIPEILSKEKEINIRINNYNKSNISYNSKN